MAATDFDLHVKRFKVIAYLIIIQKLKDIADWNIKDFKRLPTKRLLDEALCQ